MAPIGERIEANITLGSIFVHGLAFPFYLYRVWNFVLNNTRLVV